MNLQQLASSGSATCSRYRSSGGVAGKSFVVDTRERSRSVHLFPNTMAFSTSQLTPFACICGVRGRHICTTRSQSTQCHPHVRMNDVHLSQLLLFKKTSNTFHFNWNSSDAMCHKVQYVLGVLIECMLGKPFSRPSLLYDR